MRRGDHRIEFQTPQMIDGAVAEQGVELHLTVEEAEALARAAVDTQLKDRRQKRSLPRRSTGSPSCVARSEQGSKPATS